ncbi:hypothetical protein QVM55_09535, partial [Pseudomonas monteilii]|uniref:hypothetical protein n=1 Tax=Pseudomonas monteilii TaxID=76759 RepID=UPI0035249764
KAKSEKRKAKSEKRKAKSEKRKAKSEKLKRWFLYSDKSVCGGDAYSPFRPYGESLFAKRGKK